MTDFDRGYKAAQIDAMKVATDFADEAKHRYKVARPDTKYTKEFFLGSQKTAENIVDAIGKLEPFEVVN